MSNITKHVGTLSNTNKKIVVIFNQIPGREDHALILDTDALPDRVKDVIERVVQSQEGQRAENIGEILNRRMFPDTGELILSHLHSTRRLQPVPIDQVIMLPRPNNPVPLSALLKALGKNTTPTIDPDTQTLSPEDLANQVTKLNPHSLNSQVDVQSGNLQRAEDLRIQARILQDDVNRLLNEADMLAPKSKGSIVDSKTADDTNSETVEKVNTITDILDVGDSVNTEIDSEVNITELSDDTDSKNQ